jgi:predicted nuclease of restriction endonuclease-like RecB superfamily
MKTPNFKSKFEQTVATELQELLGNIDYEPDKIHFVQPAKKRFYLPDFKLRKDTYIECKGKWTADDRAKHVWIREQHPEITVYMLFQNANVRLTKRSKTTYGDWATKNNMVWADYRQGIPKEWYESKSSSGTRRRNTRSKSKPK